MALVSGNYHPALPPLGPVSVVTGGETPGVLQSHRHPNPISLDGESRLFIRVSWTGLAPTMPISQHQDMPFPGQGSARGPLCCPEWDT